MEKNNKNLNVPNLRFPEFSGEWEKCMIGDVLKVGNGKDYKHLAEGDIPVFGTGGYMLSVNDFLYDGDSVFIGRKGTINKPFFYSGKFWTVDTLFYTHSFNKVIPHFVYGLFQRVNWNNYNEASGVPSLSKSTIEKIPIAIPSIEEQQKISSLLSLLDQRIETQKKIIEKYESLIRGLTDTAFNCKSSIPLINFSNLYKDAGEGGTPSTSNSEYYDGGTIPFIKIDDIMTKYLVTHKDCITEQGMQKSSAWLIPSGSVIYSNGATIGSIAINTYPVCTKQGILGIIPKDNVDVEYLYYFMTSVYFRKEIHRIITEGTMKTAYLKDINKILCPLPDLTTQRSIANKLASMTKKIELDKQTLSLLQTQKKYLLSHLFI